MEKTYAVINHDMKANELRNNVVSRENSRYFEFNGEVIMKAKEFIVYLLYGKIYCL